MAESKVTDNQKKATLTQPQFKLFSDPITDLMMASNALEVLADKFESDDMYGEETIIRFISEKVMAIANHMDDNNWQAPEPCKEQ